jgi:hypothetical protein
VVRRHIIEDRCYVAHPNNDDDHHHGDEGKNGTFEPSLTVLEVETHL